MTYRRRGSQSSVRLINLYVFGSSRGACFSPAAPEVRLPSALLLRVITQVDGVHSPLADVLRSQCSTYLLRRTLKTVGGSSRYSFSFNLSFLISIRSMSRSAASFISIKPSLDTVHMGSPFQSNHWRWSQAIVSNLLGTNK